MSTADQCKVCGKWVRPAQADHDFCPLTERQALEVMAEALCKIAHLNSIVCPEAVSIAVDAIESTHYYELN
jgi:hypothetical protein